jgi:hypothetical protein
MYDESEMTYWRLWSLPESVPEREVSSEPKRRGASMMNRWYAHQDRTASVFNAFYTDLGASW